MKKIFSLFIAVLFMSTNVNAITAELSLGTGLGSSVTSYPNSTIYPGHYEVRLQVRTNISTCLGTYSINAQRRQSGTLTWGSFTPNIQLFPSVNSEMYNATAIVAQAEGTIYEYRVIVTYNPSGAGTCGTRPNETATSGIRTATVLGVPVPCFNMLNVQSSQNENSYYGPQNVKSICQNAVTIDGSCSKFEKGYYISIAEFNLATWTSSNELYSAWVSGTGEAPQFISLNALASQNNKYFQPGKLYIVGFSIGPVWKSADPQFFRVLGTCKTSGDEDVKDVKDVKDEVKLDDQQVLTDSANMSFYPNPVKNILSVSVDKSEKIISYVVFDNFSTIVKKEKLVSKTNELKIDFNDLKKGLYFINIETDKKSYKEKIIKE